MELGTTKRRILFCLACCAYNATSAKRGRTTDFTSLVPSYPKPPPREDEQLIKDGKVLSSHHFPTLTYPTCLEKGRAIYDMALSYSNVILKWNIQIRKIKI